MKYAVIQGGKVSNVVLATPEVAAERGWIECPLEVGIGWTFDGVNQPLPPALDAVAEAALVREKRTAMLVNSDSMVLPDRWAAMNTEQQTAWTVYRQALRDVTAQAGFPWNVTWPETP